MRKFSQMYITFLMHVPLVVKGNQISFAINSYWFDSGRGIFLQVYSVAVVTLY